MRLLVFFALAAFADAQAPVFPSDTEPAARVDAAPLFEAVCPGNVSTGNVATGDQITCRTGCPQAAGLKTFLPWSFSAVTRGHFLAPQSDDAVISTDGCETHADNFGGSILLTRRSGVWTMLWYKPGVPTARCHKVSLSTGREILVCMGVAGGMGAHSTQLYTEDLTKPVATLMAEGSEPFFSAFDNTATCAEDRPDSVTRSVIDRVEFVPAPSGPARITVTASYGKKSRTPAEIRACEPADLPATTAYRIEFVFDGAGYRPTPSTAAAAKVFR